MIVGGFAIAIAFARAAVSERAHLSPAVAPKHPVLFFNPKSGGGKAEKFSLATEAPARGIEAIELGIGAGPREARPGRCRPRRRRRSRWPAATARRRSSPRSPRSSTCPTHAYRQARETTSRSISEWTATTSSARSTPSSTAAERRVDLGEVNGRVFVNNVSLGIYAEAVQRAGYRDAKIRTLLDTVPDALGPDGSGLDLRWTGPDGQEHQLGRHDPGLEQPLPARAGGRLRNPPGDRRRPARDHGRRSADGPWRARASCRSDRGASGPRADLRGRRRRPRVPAGIDGEAVRLEPPLRFSIRTRVLRVRIAPQHPGASPSAYLPEGAVDSVRTLARTAAGRGPASNDTRTKET